jgi:predicted Rossmann fold nucleotide-binding protein DprA/Smf involved in DNA uptake
MAGGPNTLIKQGAKLTASWEDVCEDLPIPVPNEALNPIPPLLHHYLAKSRYRQLRLAG